MGLRNPMFTISIWDLLQCILLVPPNCTTLGRRRTGGSPSVFAFLCPGDIALWRHMPGTRPRWSPAPLQTLQLTLWDANIALVARTRVELMPAISSFRVRDCHTLALPSAVKHGAVSRKEGNRRTCTDLHTPLMHLTFAMVPPGAHQCAQS